MHLISSVTWLTKWERMWKGQNADTASEGKLTSAMLTISTYTVIGWCRSWIMSLFAHCTMQTLTFDMWLNSQAKLSLYDLNECLLCVVAPATEAKSQTVHDWPHFARSRSPLSIHRSDKRCIIRWLTQSFHPCDCLIQQVICFDWHCTGTLDLIMFYGSTIFMECHEHFSFTALAQILLPHPIE